MTLRPEHRRHLAETLSGLHVSESPNCHLTLEIWVETRFYHRELDGIHTLAYLSVLDLILPNQQTLVKHRWKFKAVSIDFFGNKGSISTMTQASAELMTDA